MLSQISLRNAALSLFIIAAAESWAGTYQVLRLPISDSLPQDSFADIHVDRRGFLWLMAGKQVYRYDGYSLSPVSMGKDYPNWRSSKGPRKLLIEDQRGAVWLVDATGQLRQYDPSKRSFVLKDHVPKFPTRDSRIYSVSSSTNGLLWLLLYSGDIALYETNAGLAHDVIYTSKYLGETEYLADLATDDKGNAWALTNKGTLLDCERGRQSCHRFNLANANGLKEAVDFQEISYIAPNKLIVSSGSVGVYEVSTDGYSAKRLKLPSEADVLAEPFSHVWTTSVSPSGEVWIGTIEGLLGPTGSGQLGRYSAETTNYQRLLVTNMEPMDDGSVFAVTTNDISLIRKARFESIGRHGELAGQISTAFTQVSDGTVYVGSLHGLSTFNPSSSHAESLEAIYPDLDLVDSRILAVLADGAGIWMGGFEGGLRYLNYSSGQLNQFASNEEKLSTILAIIRLDSRRLLVSTPEHGVLIVDRNGTILEEFPPHFGAKEAGGSLVISLLHSSFGKLIIGTDDGLYELSLTSESSHPKTQNASRHLAGEEVYDLLEASDGSIWAGTYQGGLYRSNGAENGSLQSFELVKTSPALPGETIYALEEDALGMLWCATNKGLVRLEPNTMTITIYNESDGLIDDEFNVGASLEDRDGFLYFGTAKGFNRFDPRDFVERQVPPPLRLTEIMVHRVPVEFDPAYFDIPELVLGHNDHSIDVEFSTMDIISPGRSRYKYRLENFDDDWVDIGTRNSATFTSLPAGKYVLRVIGADSKGVWNYDGITLPIRVLPAPWLTWWAFALYGLCALFLLALTKRSYDTYLEKNAATAEARQMKITATLAMDDLQDQLEVENRLVSNLRKHASDTFDMVDELLSLEVEELLGDQVDEPLGRARQRLQALKALESSVYFHGDLIKVNLRDAIDRSFADIIKTHPHPQAELVLANDCSEELVPVDIAAPLVVLAHELILNSVLHAFPDTEGVHCVEVAFQQLERGWQFSLADAGCGLPQSIDPSRPTTLGMELVSRIVSRLDATIEVNRETGTRYRVTIPG